MNRLRLMVSVLMLAAVLIQSACQTTMGTGRQQSKAGKVHVLFSKMNSEKYGYAGSDRTEVQLTTAGFDVQRISDQDLATLNGITPDDVVVMSSVYVMNEDAIAALTRFAQQGGGVLWIDAPTPTIPNSAALRDLLGCSVFTVNWSANYNQIEGGRPLLYKHFINGDRHFFSAYHCAGNSAWAPSTAYEFGRFPPVNNKEWDIASRSPVKLDPNSGTTGIIDRIPVWTLNMVGDGRVVLFNWKAQHFGGYASMDMIRRATAWLLADGNETKAEAILAGKTGFAKPVSSRVATIETSGQPKIEPLGKTGDYKLQMGIFVRPQNYGQTGRGPGQVDPAPLADWPMFKKMVDNLKMIGSQRVTLSTGPASLVGPRDLVQEFCDAMHAEGFKVDSYSGDFGPRGPNLQAIPGAGVVGNPGSTRREGAGAMAVNTRDAGRRDRPTTSPQSTQNLQNLPSFQTVEQRRVVGCLWEFEPRWAEFIDNLIERDLDGLCVPPDEYSRPVYNGDPRADNECTRRFHQQYGMVKPDGDWNDTPEWRAWMNYEYNSLAEVYSRWNNLVLQKKPNVQRTNIIYVGELCHNWRAPINWGAIGHASDWSAFMTDPYVGLHMDLTDHWYVPETVKRLAASTKGRQAMVTLQNNRLREFNEQLRPLHVYGETVSSIANGGKGVHFFHYFKIFDDNGDPYYGRIENTIMANSLMRTLDKWGAADGQVPQQIALLFGQMSQDYVWLVRNRNLGNGYDSQQASIDMLLANGYPFDVYCMDQEESWARLPGATKVIIVPFAYAVSDNTVAQLEGYAKAGKKIIIMQRLGEADMKGDVRPTPALNRLIAEYPESVTRIEGDITMGRMSPDYEANYCKTIDAALGDDKQVNLDRAGQDIEATLLNLQGGRKILFAINWERQPARFGLGVNLPEGNYRLTERNLKGTQPASINGKDVLTARDLRNFAVNLKTEELKFWLIEPVS